MIYLLPLKEINREIIKYQSPNEGERIIYTKTIMYWQNCQWFKYFSVTPLGILIWKYIWTLKMYVGCVERYFKFLLSASTYQVFLDLVKHRFLLHLLFYYIHCYVFSVYILWCSGSLLQYNKQHLWSSCFQFGCRYYSRSDHSTNNGYRRWQLGQGNCYPCASSGLQQSRTSCWLFIFCMSNVYKCDMISFLC